MSEQPPQGAGAVPLRAADHTHLIDRVLGTPDRLGHRNGRFGLFKGQPAQQWVQRRVEAMGSAAISPEDLRFEAWKALERAVRGFTPDKARVRPIRPEVGYQTAFAHYATACINRAIRHFTAKAKGKPRQQAVDPEVLAWSLRLRECSTTWDHEDPDRLHTFILRLVELFRERDRPPVTYRYRLDEPEAAMRHGEKVREWEEVAKLVGATSAHNAGEAHRVALKRLRERMPEIVRMAEECGVDLRRYGGPGPEDFADFLSEPSAISADTPISNSRGVGCSHH